MLNLKILHYRFSWKFDRRFRNVTCARVVKRRKRDFNRNSARV